MLKKFFSKMKSKALGVMLQKQLANVPPEQRDMIMAAMEKNPELFERMAKDIEEAKKKGGNEMYASMLVMQKYRSELQSLMVGAAAPKRGGKVVKMNKNNAQKVIQANPGNAKRAIQMNPSDTNKVKRAA